MNARIKGLVTMAALLAAAACGDASIAAPDEASFARGGGSYGMTFSSMQDYDNNVLTAPRWVSGTVGSMEFGGTLVTPTPCYTLTAANAVTARGVEVTVTVTRTGEACIQVLTDNHYTGTLTGMPAGTYRVRVLEQVGTGRPTEAYNGTVTVQ